MNSAIWWRWQIQDWLYGGDPSQEAARVSSGCSGDALWMGLSPESRRPPTAGAQNTERMEAGWKAHIEKARRSAEWCTMMYQSRRLAAEMTVKEVTRDVEEITVWAKSQQQTKRLAGLPGLMRVVGG